MASIAVRSLLARKNVIDKTKRRFVENFFRDESGSLSAIHPALQPQTTSSSTVAHTSYNHKNQAVVEAAQPTDAPDHVPPDKNALTKSSQTNGDNKKSQCVFEFK